MAPLKRVVWLALAVLVVIVVFPPRGIRHKTDDLGITDRASTPASRRAAWQSDGLPKAKVRDRLLDCVRVLS